MTTTTKTTETKLTAEQIQQSHAAALEDARNDVNVRYERSKTKFAEVAAKSGYDYAACWQLEETVTVEYLVRFMAAPINMLKLLVEGEYDLETIRAQMAQYRDELLQQLVHAKPWEHHCTCAITNVTCLWQATARATAVEMIEKIIRHDLRY